MLEQERNIEIFDLDHTLFKVNSSFRFGIFLYRNKVLSTRKMLFLIGCYAFHKLGGMKIATLNNIASRHFFLGKSLTLINKMVVEFLNQEFETMVNPSIANQLSLAKNDNAYTIILSSSPDFIVRKVAEKFNVDEWAATQYSVDKNNVLCGIKKMIEGKDKADFVNDMIKLRGIPKEKIFGYTDSHHDIPFLEVVGKQIAVNPDHTLEKICKERGWTIYET